MKKTIASLLVAGSLLGTSAYAASLNFSNNWNLNLANTGEGLSGSVEGINQILYKGLSRVTVTDVDGLGTINVGDTFKVDGLMYATSFDGIGSTIDDKGLNSSYELTMKFSALGQFDGINSMGALTFFHYVPGSLDIYVDKLGTQADKYQGTGFTDGTNIASFALSALGGTGGTYYAGVNDGADDAYFSTISHMLGVFQNPDGTNMTSALAGVFTRSNFSGDLATTPNYTNWNSVFGAPEGDFTFFVDENGDGRVVTPEPGTIALLGLGLAGLGLYSRRKRQ